MGKSNMAVKLKQDYKWFDDRHSDPKKHKWREFQTGDKLKFVLIEDLGEPGVRVAPGNVLPPRKVKLYLDLVPKGADPDAFEDISPGVGEPVEPESSVIGNIFGGFFGGAEEEPVPEPEKP